MNPQPENAKTEGSFDDVLADCDWTAHPETLLSNANVLSVNTQAGRQNCPEVPLSAVRIFWNFGMLFRWKHSGPGTCHAEGVGDPTRKSLDQREFPGQIA